MSTTHRYMPVTTTQSAPRVLEPTVYPDVAGGGSEGPAWIVVVWVAIAIVAAVFVTTLIGVVVTRLAAVRRGGCGEKKQPCDDDGAFALTRMRTTHESDEPKRQPSIASRVAARAQSWGYGARGSSRVLKDTPSFSNALSRRSMTCSPDIGPLWSTNPSRAGSLCASPENELAGGIDINMSLYYTPPTRSPYYCSVSSTTSGSQSGDDNRARGDPVRCSLANEPPDGEWCGPGFTPSPIPPGSASTTAETNPFRSAQSSRVWADDSTMGASRYYTPDKWTSQDASAVVMSPETPSPSSAELPPTPAGVTRTTM